MKHKQLILLLITFWQSAIGQSLTKADSIYLFRLLEQADTYDFEGKMDSAFIVIDQILKSTTPNYRVDARSFALLKKADLLQKEKGSIPEVEQLCEKGKELGLKIGNKFIVGLSNHQLSQYYRDQNAYDKAIEKLKEASQFYDEVEYPEYLGLVYNDMGHIYSRLGDYGNAFENYIKAIKVFEKSGFDKEIANTTGNMAVDYYRLGDKVKSIELFKKSSDIREKISDIKGLAANYGNLATIYQSISLDSALIYQEKALFNAKKSGILNNIAQSNMNTALILAKQKNFLQAIPYELEAIDNYHNLGDELKVANRKLSLASLYRSSGQVEKAQLIFKELETNLPKLNNRLLYENFHLAISNHYKAIGDFEKSLPHLEAYFAYKDSTSSDKQKQYVAELETKYETEKSKAEISSLQIQKKLSFMKLENQQNLLFQKELESKLKGEEISLLSKENEISKSKMLFEKQSSQQKEEALIFKQKMMENEKVVAQHIIRQQKLVQFGLIFGLGLFITMAWLFFSRYNLRRKVLEKEKLLEIRNQLSMELHDEVGSTLTSINLLSKIGVSTLINLKGDDQKVNVLLNRIETQSKSVQQNLSDIVWALKPDNQNAASLVSRLYDLSNAILEPAEIKTTINHIEEKQSISFNEFELKEVLLITKEAMHNVVKHSGANNVNIILNSEIKNGKKALHIIDNGLWDEKSKNRGSGSGLFNMQERAKKIGGNIVYEKSTSGTTLLMTWG